VFAGFGAAPQPAHGDQTRPRQQQPGNLATQTFPLAGGEFDGHDENVEVL
jgi:hypothetical protein